MSYFIEGSSGRWEVVMGLEVHAQIKSKSKLFSVASTDWGGDPNSQVCLLYTSPSPRDGLLSRMPSSA